jgi:glycosyltransferase involved in cell wall biosynthesis
VSETLAVLPPHSTTRKPRVVYLDHCAQLSGGELALARLLPALDVDAVVILAEDGPLVDRLRADCLKVEVLPLNEAVRGASRHEAEHRGTRPSAVAATVRHIAALRARLRELDPALVHTNSLKAGVYGSLAARTARVPVIWHVRDRIADDYLPSRTAAVLRVLIDRLPQAVIANSVTTASTLRRPRDAHVIGSPLSLDHLDVRRTAEERLRIGIVGRLAPWKGQDVFLRAFASAFGGSEAQAVVIGASLFDEGDYRERLEAMAKDLGIDDQVEFTGFVADPWREVARLTVLVHASVVPEPFGQVIIEGLAARVPVVATWGGGPEEIITSGINGVLYEAGDSAALAAALRKLADDPALRERLSEAGRMRAADFDPSHIADQVMSVYRHVLGQAEGPPASVHQQRPVRSTAGSPEATRKT